MGDQQEIDSLPNIFIANIPDSPEVSKCVTGTSADHVVLNIPNPGKNGRILEYPSDPQQKPSNYCSDILAASVSPSFISDTRTIQSSGGAPNATYRSPTASQETSIIQSSARVTASSVSHSLTSTGGAYSNSLAVTETRVATSSEVTTVSYTSREEPSLPPTASPVGAVTCSDHGALICIENEMFGICDWGLAIPQKVAAGTECVDGKIVTKSAERRAHE